MKLIITGSIEKISNNIGLDFDYIYYFIKNNRPNGFIKLCSPINGTIAYKGYMDSLKRIIIFNIHDSGIIYPVYIGDKNDKIAKNITVNIIRKYAEKRHKQIEQDLKNKKLKIRHF